MKKQTLRNSVISSENEAEAKMTSDILFLQVDNNLSVINSLGIPTSATDELNSDVEPANTAKLIYNSTLQKLRIYNPLTSSWTDANPVNLANYYTKEQIDSLLNALPTSTPLTFNSGMWVKDKAVQLGLDMTTLGTTNVGKLEGTTAFLIGDPHNEVSFSVIADGSVNSAITTAKYQLENGIGLTAGKYQASARLTLNDLITPEKNAGFDARIDEGHSHATMYAANRGFDITWRSAQEEYSTFNVFDRDNLKGLVYEADYSLKGKADNKWIPDWGTVKSEIPKMFSFTASGDGITTKFRVPHGLISPIAVSITPNTKDALGKCYDSSNNIVFGGGVFAYIDGVDIVIENLNAENPEFAFLSGTNNLKWTITVR